MTEDRSPLIVWHRRDLRLRDNPALYHACKTGRPVIPVFIWSPEEEGPWEPGAASRWWLHHSLLAFQSDLAESGLSLRIRSGESLRVLKALVKETGATTVFWNRLYDPAALVRDTEVKTSLRGMGLEVKSYNAALLCEPWEIQTREENPYQVFTPFWKALRMEVDASDPLPAPKKLQGSAPDSEESAVEDLGLLPRIDWAGGMRAAWTPGEKGAWKEFDRFRRAGLEEYPEARDYPAIVGTSRLSPHLHFGEIGPRQIWAKLLKNEPGDLLQKRGAPAGEYLREVAWREFAHHLLYHFPHTPERPLRDKFLAFPWEENPEALGKWKKGQTGYPIVDAGMRELWTTGWMHNRVRMIVASFLVKDLRIHWLSGARWFWDTLVDADLASNTLGWQWTAGCGADAAPYFRIFNPVRQGEKFDPSGEYVRKWVPEIAALPDKWIHAPWEADARTLAEFGIRLGEDYPEAMVDHTVERDRALEAFQSLK